MSRLREIPAPTRLRILALVVGIVLALRAASQDLSSATKADMVLPSGNASAGVGLMQLLQLFLAVAIVVAIIRFALPKLAPMVGRKLHPALGSSIRIEESATFAGGNLYVVAVRGRTLLLSVAQQGVSCLADLTPSGKEEEQPAFFELLDDASARQDAKTPSHAVVSDAAGQRDAPARASASQELLQALARLDRIAG